MLIPRCAVAYGSSPVDSAVNETEQTISRESLNNITIDANGRAWSNTLIVAALLLQSGHLVVTLLGLHARWWSNVFQLGIALFTIAICLRQLRHSTSATIRRCWVYVSFAFVIWSLAQGLYLHDMYRSALHILGRSADDGLWLLVGLPLLIAVYPTLQDADAIGWLDKAQIAITFSCLYLLVFGTPGALSVGTAYNLQNFLLAICCFIKISSETAAAERRFFVHLAMFFVLYATLDSIAGFLFSRGWTMGTPLETAYTIPFTVFCVLLLRNSLSDSQCSKRSVKQNQTINHLHSLSIGLLPIIAIGASVHVAQRRPFIGETLLLGAVVTFLLRIAKRETAWNLAQRALEDAVLRDPLTGLGNRVLLRQRLEDANGECRPGEHATLIFADLDRFKAVNDTLGHDQGDKLLVTIGERLLRVAPPEATVCRFGGDEFVLFTQVEDARVAEHIGSCLLEAIRPPVQLGEHIVRCTASVGVVFAAKGSSTEDLLCSADLAMYQAKRSGKDRVTLFQEVCRRDVTAN